MMLQLSIIFNTLVLNKIILISRYIVYTLVNKITCIFSIKSKNESIENVEMK